MVLKGQPQGSLWCWDCFVIITVEADTQTYTGGNIVENLVTHTYK